MYIISTHTDTQKIVSIIIMESMEYFLLKYTFIKKNYIAHMEEKTDIHGGKSHFKAFLKCVLMICSFKVIKKREGGE